MHLCHSSPHASWTQAHPTTACRVLHTRARRHRKTHPQAAASAARKQQPPQLQQQPQDWQQRVADEEQLARLLEQVTAEETSFDFDFLWLEEAPSTATSLEDWLQEKTGNGGRKEQGTPLISLESGVSTSPQPQQVLYPPESSTEASRGAQQQSPQRAQERQRRRRQPAVAPTRTQQVSQQQPPQIQQQQQRQQRQQQDYEHRQQQQPWWSLPVRQAEAACPPPVATALRRTSRGPGPDEDSFSPLSGDGSNFNLAGARDTTIFVKGLNSQAPERLMRAALVEAFSQAGQLAQVRLPSTSVPSGDKSGSTTRELKGIAFIVYQSPESKARAVEQLANACILGRFIRVDADPDSRSRSSSRSGRSSDGDSNPREAMGARDLEGLSKRKQRWAHLQQHEEHSTSEPSPAQEMQQQSVAEAPQPKAARRRGRYLG